MEDKSKKNISKVYIIKTDDRNYGIPELMKNFSLEDWSGDHIALKANYNSSDEYPASTHIETLKNIVSQLIINKTGKITLAERSGMGDTRDVLEKRGVFSLSEELGKEFAAELGEKRKNKEKHDQTGKKVVEGKNLVKAFETVVLNEIGASDWRKISGSGNHWMRGFYLPELIFESDRIVETCCLKTHRFGGHFTLSLKNFVGWVAKNVPGGIYDYMAELHVSPFQRQMIAEINQHFQTDMIIMDAIKGFVTQGPEKGQEIEPNLLLASSDRVAMDAVGVAILRTHGVKSPVGKGDIFQQTQLKRAAELKIGVSSTDEIELINLNNVSKEDINEIKSILRTEH
jgi:uncharacterized protein (DUF362 family)